MHFLMALRINVIWCFRVVLYLGLALTPVAIIYSGIPLTAVLTSPGLPLIACLLTPVVCATINNLMYIMSNGALWFDGFTVLSD